MLSSRVGVSGVIVVLCIGFFQSRAQDSPLYNELKARYPEAPLVAVERAVTMTIITEHDSLKCFSETRESFMWLKEPATMFANRQVGGSSFMHVRDLKGHTRIWNGNKYKESPVTDFKKKFDEDNNIFFDDSYVYSFTFPTPARGNIGEWSYRQDFSDPRIIENFAIGYGVPEELAVFTVKTSENVELDYRIFNDEKKMFQFREYKKGGFRFYEWKAQHIPTFRSEPDAPSPRYVRPVILINIKSYTVKGSQRRVLSGLDDLHTWYRDFLNRAKNEGSDSLKQLVEQIRGRSKDDLEFARRTLYWVQNNIQYIAFEDGMRGFVPHSGAYTFSKRYGDCKDMANLIVTMLRLGGAEAYQAWIGTRDLPYKYSEFVTPQATNHMIATFRSAKGEWYFLDGTSKYTPFGMPSWMIQGKEALIAREDKEFEVREVPVIKPENNLMTDSVRVTISGNMVSGEGTARLSGFLKVKSSYQVSSVKEEVKRQNLNNIVGKGSNKFVLKQYNILNLEDQDRPLQINYQFTVDNYVTRVQQDVIINMHLDRDLYNQLIKADRIMPIESDFMFTKKQVYKLTIPEGYTVDYLPPDAKFDGPNLSFSIHYQQRGKELWLEKTLVNKVMLLRDTDFEDWNKSIKALSEAYKESVILKSASK